MFKVIDSKWLEGEFLRFKDDGLVSPGSVTHTFSVTSRLNASYLGSVKWYTQWRKYCFFPVNAIFDAKCLKEIAGFCEIATDYHRAEKRTPAQVIIERSRT